MNSNVTSSASVSNNGTLLLDKSGFLFTHSGQRVTTIIFQNISNIWNGVIFETNPTPFTALTDIPIERLKNFLAEAVNTYVSCSGSEIHKVNMFLPSNGRMTVYIQSTLTASFIPVVIPAIDLVNIATTKLLNSSTSSNTSIQIQSTPTPNKIKKLNHALSKVLEPKPEEKATCSTHDPVLYEGLIEKYYYCKVCDEKLHDYWG